jgi:TPR repeat protein
MFALWTLLKAGDEGVPADAAGADRYLELAASSGFMEAMYHRGMELMREARRCGSPFWTLNSWSGSR